MKDMKAQRGVTSWYLPELLTDRLDSILSILLLLGGTAIVALSYIAGIGQYGLGFALLCAPIVYALVRKVSKNHGLQMDYLKIQQPGVNLNLILDVCFWVLYSTSLVILYDIL